MQRKLTILNEVVSAARTNPIFSRLFEQLCITDPGIGVHLAIFTEPFLTLILDGKKTIESRFTKNRCSPHGKIFSGDVVMLKKAGGPVVGMFIAGEIKHYPKLDKKTFERIKSDYHINICAYADSEFWSKRENSQIATLVTIEHLWKLHPFYVHKSDRSGWVVLRTRDENLKLGLDSNNSGLNFTL